MNDKEQLARDILKYLIKNPNAQDTLKGIDWWLLGRRTKHRTAVVQEVLNDLVDEGYLIAYKGSDSQTHYKINLRKLRKIENRLKS